MTAIPTRDSIENTVQRSIPLCLAVIISGALTCAFGQFVYVVNPGSDISAFTFDTATGALKTMAGSPFVAGVDPAGLAVDPASRFVYVANAGSNDISGFSIDEVSGSLSAIPGSPFPAGAAPSGIAIERTGRFAYVANSGSNDVSAYTIDQTTGALTPNSRFAAGAEPAGVTVTPNGRFLYVADVGAGGISAYAIQTETGALTPIAGSPFALGGKAQSVVIDAAGKFAYVTGADAAASSLWAFSIDSASGALAAVPGSPLAMKGGPLAVAAHPSGKFVYVASGADISAYGVEPKTGALTLISGWHSAGVLGSGLAIDRSGKFVYQAGDFAGDIPVFAVDAETGALRPSSGFAAGRSRSRHISVGTAAPRIVVANPALALPGTPLITSFTPGALTDPPTQSTGGFGMSFTVGAVPLNVTALGRIYIAGNTGSHVVRLVNASDKTDVLGGSVTVTLPPVSGNPGDFVYAPLANPVTLTANTTYYLLSGETNNGDPFYNAGPVVSTSAAVVNSAEVEVPAGNFTDVGRSNFSDVPVNLLYMPAGTPPTISITAPIASAIVSGSSVPASANAMAANGLSIANVKFLVDNANPVTVTTSPYSILLNSTTLTNATHMLTAVATDTGGNTNTSAPVSFTVNNLPSTASVTAPITGAILSGTSVGLSATATPANGLTITGVQFKVDTNAPVTASGGPSTYNSVLDSTQLTNGPHSVVAIATDSGGHVVTSSLVSFTVNNSSTNVSITSPAPNAAVSGSVMVTVMANPGTGLTIGGVQLKVDSGAPGASVTTSPYTFTLDTTQLSNGMHTLVAVATDSAHAVVMSAPVTILVSNSNVPPPSGTPLIASFTSGTPRNDYTGGAGMRFTVGAMPLNVLALGRIYIAGNTGSHVLRLVNAGDGTDVPGGSVTLALPSGNAGQFAYASLTNPVRLAANTSYYLLSQETAGGDQFYNAGPVTPTSAATVDNAELDAPGLGFVAVGRANFSDVPVNLLYMPAGTPPTVNITAPGGGTTISGNSVAVSATATAVTGTIANVQFLVDNANPVTVTTSPYGITLDTTTLTNATHTLTARATDTGGNTTSASVTVTVNNAPTAVAVTVPAASAMVSGTNVAVSATAAPANGLTITGVQFKVDTNAPVAATGGPVVYGIVLDSTQLNNGPHSVVAIATDSGGHMVTSAPVSFTVNNSAAVVTITVPAPGSGVSGIVTVMATATPGTGPAITGVQLKVDSNAPGSSVATSPYTFTVDTTQLSNGMHSLVAIATDSANHVAMSAPVIIVVSNSAAPPPSGTPLIASFTSGTPRNDYTGGAGMRFTVGAMPLNVLALGRIYIAGNTGSHVLRLVNAGDGTDVPGGSVTLTLPSGNAGQFAYASLTNPVRLAANTSYYLLSQETAGGDQFYNAGPVTPTSAATVDNAELDAPGLGFVAVGRANFSDVPVNLLYMPAGTPPTVNITAPGAGTTISGNSVAVSATATAATGTIANVQFLVDNANPVTVTTSPYGITLDTTTLTNATHTLTARATDTGGNITSASITVTVNNAPTAVAVTVPAAGAMISGTNVAVSATAAPANGLTITGVQFKVDTNAPVAATGGPVVYGIVLDSTQLNNGPHSVVAIATDSGGHMVTSAPVSFTVNNSAAVVTITVPAPGAGVSGIVTVMATATPGTGPAITGVQLKVDSNAPGAATGTSPYTFTLDTTQLSNGAHSLVAIATDAANHVAMSAPVTILVSNSATPPPSGTALVTSFTPGDIRNNFTGGFGMRFTVGAAPLNVTALGRIYIAGNTGSHVVRLVNASDGTDVPGGSVTITLPSGNAGQFVYAPVTGVTLAPNTSYYLVSAEVNGGDQFYNAGPLTATNAASVDSGVVEVPGDGFIPVGRPNFGFVPVNLLYTVGP